MHKIRSKVLYAYLKEQGVLKGSKRDILIAKRNYRRLYKNNHARQARRSKREIRFQISKQEFQQTQALCDAKYKVTPTGLAKQLLLSRVSTGAFIPDSSRLLAVLKQLGIAINQLNTDKTDFYIIDKLLQAEKDLLEYINMRNK